MREYGMMQDGRTVTEYTLRNREGLVVRFLSLGGIVTAIEVPDRAGQVDNVVLGLPDLAAYEARNESYRFGALMGRYAGRIAGARFPLDGRIVRLDANEGPNALHGGAGEGFDAGIWEVEPLGADAARLTYASADREQGFPGRLEVAVTYRLEGMSLRIDYEASTDAPTVHNLTSHSYFNLAGAGAGPVTGHRLRILARRIAEASEAGIPTGAFLPVAGTPFDFLGEHPLGDRLAEAGPVSGFRGYNHSFLMDREAPDALAPAARVVEPVTGRTLELLTTEPTLHIYTANHFPGTDLGNAGIPLAAYHGLALETQHLPDSPNHPAFPTTELRPGEVFRSTTVFRFGVER
jgi:aldose 1-epimerase